jgi:hypothetical protein
MQIMVTAEDLSTVVDHGSVITVSGTVIGSRGIRKVTFSGTNERMNRLLAVVAGTGEALINVDPWQVLGEAH